MNPYSYICCSDNADEENQILSQLSLLKLLSEKNRLQILCVLNSKNHTVNELVEHLNVSQSLVSHHLISLKDEHLVAANKKGRFVLYSLTKKGEEVHKLLKVLSSKEEK